MSTEPKLPIQPFNTAEWTINLNAIASVEWDDYYFEAEIKMITGQTYAIADSEDYRRLAAILGHALPDKPEWMSNCYG